MVFDPSKEKEAIGAAEPEVRFCVAGIGRYFDLDTPLPDSILHTELSTAIKAATDWSLDVDGTIVIFPYPHAEDQRQAISVAIGGELYVRGGIEPDPAPITDVLDFDGFSADEIKSLLIMLVARIPTVRELSAMAAMVGAVAAVIDANAVTTPGDVARVAITHGEALATALEGASE